MDLILEFALIQFLAKCNRGTHQIHIITLHTDIGQKMILKLMLQEGFLFQMANFMEDWILFNLLII